MQTVLNVESFRPPQQPGAANRQQLAWIREHESNGQVGVIGDVELFQKLLQTVYDVVE